MTRIYLSAPHVGALEREMLLEAFDSNWIAPVGPDVDAFEREVADMVGMPHAVALSSGTAALHLALELLGVVAGQDVLVSTFTFVASANAVIYRGARPVFVDADAASWNMDPDLLAEELDRRAAGHGRQAAAVVVTDLYGQCADYDRILKVCRDHGVPVIEDAAEALGATYGGRPAGSFGDLGVFSFNGNKIITTSGGGMLVTRSAEWAERARFLATQARDPAPHYQHSVVGYNYRLSNLLAALGRAQLRNLGDRVRARKANRAFYEQALAGLPGIEFAPVDPSGEPNYWLTCIMVDPEAFGATREDIRLRLEAKDIESRPTWKPLHLQPVYAECPVVGGSTSAAVFEQGLCLPSGSNLSEADLELVASEIRAAGPTT